MKNECVAGRSTFLREAEDEGIVNLKKAKTCLLRGGGEELKAADVVRDQTH